MSAVDLNLAVTQYTNQVELQLQQMGSRFNSAVSRGNHIGEQAVATDQYAPVSAREVSDSAGPIVWVDVQNARRWVFPNNWDFAAGIDNFVKLQLLNDPQSWYVQAGVQAMLRSQDDIIIKSFFDTSYTGKSPTTPVTFPSAQIVPVATGASTATGINVQKLLYARELLLEAEVDLEREPIYCALSAKQMTNLLNEIQINSKSYNEVPVLVSGKLTSFLGFNFIHSERLLLNASGQRMVPVWAKSGIHFGVWNELLVDVSQRKDKVSLPYQVYMMGTYGATRTQEEKIVQIPCVES